jgi:hypothetical protein
MSYPTIVDPHPPTPDVVSEAKLLCLMPGANALTRALTAAILARDGSLEEAPHGAESGSRAATDGGLPGARGRALP